MLGQRGRVVVGDGRGDQVPAGRHADLPGVVERAESADRHRLFQIDVVEHDQRGIAAELEVHPLQPGRRRGRNRLAGPGGTGEGDHRDLRVVDHRGADIGAAGQHMQQTRGQAGLLEDPGEHHAAADRGARIGLADHRVAQRESRRDGPDRQDDRRIERRDDADNPDRQPAATSTTAAGSSGGSRRPGGWPEPLPPNTPRPPLPWSGIARRAGSRRTPGSASRGSRPRARRTGRRPAQHRRPPVVGQRGPLLLRLRRGLARLVHIGRGGRADPGQGLAGGRLDGVILPARPGGPAAGVDLALPRACSRNAINVTSLCRCCSIGDSLNLDLEHQRLASGRQGGMTSSNAATRSLSSSPRAPGSRGRRRSG